MRFAAPGLLVAIGLAIGIAWGWGALLVYAFFATIAGGIAYAAGVGGDWLTRTSRGRFDRKDRSR